MRSKNKQQYLTIIGDKNMKDILKIEILFLIKSNIKLIFSKLNINQKMILKMLCLEKEKYQWKKVISISFIPNFNNLKKNS